MATHAQLDKWPADRCEAKLMKEAVCSQTESAAHNRQEKESNENDDKRNDRIITPVASC